MNLDDYKVTVEFTSNNPHTKISGAIIDTIFAMFGRRLLDKYRHLVTSSFDERSRTHVIELTLYVLSESDIKKIQEVENGVEKLLKGLKINVKKSR